MKKSVLLSIAAIFFTLQLICQGIINDRNFSDASFVIGLFNEKASACEFVTYDCTCDSKFFYKGYPVIVCGIYRCINPYTLKSTDYFEFVKKDRMFYIEKDNLSFETDIDYFNEILNFTENQKIGFRENAKVLAETLYLQDAKEITTFLKSCEQKGLAVLSWNIYKESECTESTGFLISYLNTTKKAIKYITTTLVGYNQGGVKILNDVTKSYTCMVKTAELIKAGNTGFFKFDHVWTSDSVETAKITSIVVQYMDGTTITIANPDSICLKPALYHVILEEME